MRIWRNDKIAIIGKWLEQASHAGGTCILLVEKDGWEISIVPLGQCFVRWKRRVVLSFCTLSTVGVGCLSWVSGSRSCRGALVSTNIEQNIFGGVIRCGNGGFTTVDVVEVNDLTNATNLRFWCNVKILVATTREN